MTNEFLPEGMKLGTAENRESLASAAGLENAMLRGTVLEAVATLCDSDLRLHVDLGGIEGIIEPEEAMLCRADEVRKDIAIITRVGKPTAFCVTGIKASHGKTVALLSRKRAQQKCAEYYLAGLRPGDVVPAKVTHLEPFGAFLDIGCGIPTLLSVDCISVSRISHPRDRLTTGAVIPVVIKNTDRETGRIYVTLRELLGTWEENAALFHAGETVTGILRSVESYGVFVELTPNLAGLAELREEDAPELRAKIGHCVSVYIKSIVPERMKIKLVLIDTHCPELPPKTLRFYVDPKSTPHMNRWLYSPAESKKTVETVFSDEIQM